MKVNLSSLMETHPIAFLWISTFTYLLVILVRYEVICSFNYLLVTV